MYYAERNKSIRERQIYDFTHIWNLRNKRDECKGRVGKRTKGNKSNEPLNSTSGTSTVDLKQCRIEMNE